jgi:serine/threonine protein kinase
MLKSKIKNAKVIFPDRIQYRIDYSDDLVDLIKKLLEKDRTKRIGSKGGVDEILAHPWFAGVDRLKLENYQIIPPFKPTHEEGNLTEFFNSKDSAQAM